MCAIKWFAHGKGTQRIDLKKISGPITRNKDDDTKYNNRYMYLHI